MPGDCMVTPTIETFRRKYGSNPGQKLPAPEVIEALWQEITTRPLTLPEARAVARPFFPTKLMTDDDATSFIQALKDRNVTDEEKAVIALSVIQSERLGDEELKGIEQWIEKENPSLEAVERRAEEIRTRRISELRLFPQVRELLESLQT